MNSGGYGARLRENKQVVKAKCFTLLMINISSLLCTVTMFKLMLMNHGHETNEEAFSERLLHP